MRKIKAMKPRQSPADPKRGLKKNSFYLRKIRCFIKETSPDQWNKLKHFLRTGERLPGLRRNTVLKFAERGFDYKEAVNARRRKPYTAKFSSQEKREIKRQIIGLVGLLFPQKTTKNKTELVEKVFSLVKPLERADVNLLINAGSPASVFRSGRLYLDALDRHNEPNAKKNGLENAKTGYVVLGKKHQIILGKNWRAKNYDKTTPLHEAAHYLLGSSEYKANLLEFYYSLKNQIMDKDYFSKLTLEDQQTAKARTKAIELFLLGRQKGWGKAEEQLRKELK